MTGWKRHLSLTQRLLALTAVALLPTLAALIYLIGSVHRERELQVRDLALRTGELASLEMKRIVTGAEAALVALAHSQLVTRFDSPGCDRYLTDVSAALPQFGAITAADLTGRVRCASAPDLAGTRMDPYRHFSEAIDTKAFVVGELAHAQADDRVLFLPLALPILDRGEAIGVIAARLDLAWLGQQIRGREFAEGSALTVADREGTIIAREPDPERFVGTRIPAPFQDLVHAERPGTMAVTSQDGTERVIGYFPPTASGVALYVSAGVSTEVAFAPVYASTYRSLGLAALGSAAAFCFAWLLGNRLVRAPIRRLVATVDAWRRGDETARTGIAARGTEISTLAFAIDRYMDELAVDRAALREAEARRELLFREMEHRIKNVLATVQAVARQTLRGKAMAEGLEDFQRRLAAMAETHQILLSENWQRADLRASLQSALHPFGLVGSDRLSLHGLPLQITARATLPLSMVIHELGTNATKYGALADANGSVAIAWHVADTDAGRRFVLTWTEQDGPPVEEPTRSGFGTRLINAALASDFGAEVSLDFPPTGVVFRLDADACRILADLEPEQVVAA